MWTYCRAHYVGVYVLLRRAPTVGFFYHIGEYGIYYCTVYGLVTGSLKPLLPVVVNLAVISTAITNCWPNIICGLALN